MNKLDISKRVVQSAASGRHFLAVIFLVVLLVACKPHASVPENTPSPGTAISPTSPAATLEKAWDINNLQILYLDADRNLWVWQQLFGSRQIIPSADIVEALLIPDSEQLIFVRSSDAGYSLWVANVDGTRSRELISTEQFNGMPSVLPPNLASPTSPRDLQWIPGTHTLAFTTARKTVTPDWTYNNDLWVVNTDTFQLTLLIPAGQGGRPVFSPDGTRIALVSTTSISMVHTDGTGFIPQILTYPIISTYTKSQYFPLPVWSADSRTLWAVVPPKNSLNLPAEETSIWKILPDEARSELVNQVETYPLLWPEISPDLSFLIYQAPMPEQPGIPVTRLTLLNLATSTETVYYTDQIQFHGWAPDSLHFVFTAGQGSLYTILGNRNESPVSLPQPGASGQVTWLDANHFLFFSQDKISWQLRLATTRYENQTLATLSRSSSQEPIVCDFIY